MFYTLYSALWQVSHILHTRDNVCISYHPVGETDTLSSLINIKLVHIKSVWLSILLKCTSHKSYSGHYLEPHISDRDGRECILVSEVGVDQEEGDW